MQGRGWGYHPINSLKIQYCSNQDALWFVWLITTSIWPLQRYNLSFIAKCNLAFSSFNYCTMIQKAATRTQFGNLIPYRFSECFMYLFVLTMKKKKPTHDTDNQPKTHTSWPAVLGSPLTFIIQVSWISPAPVSYIEKGCVLNRKCNHPEKPPAHPVLEGGSGLHTQWTVVTFI